MPVVLAQVTDQPLDADALVALVQSPTSGAVACFFGQIRDHDPEASGEVVGITYTHHPDAGRLIGEIVARVVAGIDGDGVALVAAAHRVGRLEVGDLALGVVVATPHRGLGFELCPAIVEAIKEELPIWKQQFEADGRAVWSALGVDQ